MWIQNTNQSRISSLTITYDELLNLKVFLKNIYKKLADLNKSGDNQHTLTVKPGETAVSWCEKITSEKAQILKWRFKFHHK